MNQQAEKAIDRSYGKHGKGITGKISLYSPSNELMAVMPFKTRAERNKTINTWKENTKNLPGPFSIVIVLNP